MELTYLLRFTSCPFSGDRYTDRYNNEILVSIGTEQCDRSQSNTSSIAMIGPWKKIAVSTKELFADEGFLKSIHIVENLVSKILSIALVGVILVSLLDLIVFLYKDLFREPVGFFNKTLIEIFGMFLNILIALELLENITAYLRKHVVQVELVIVTALIAVARKLIIFDFSKASGIDLVGLATASFALSISYWLIRQMNRRHREDRR